MAIIHVNETYAGLPNSGRLSGTNGDLVGIMDIALPLNGWAIEYTSGNARVYRPGSGNRFRLYMNDDSSVSGQAYLTTVRGCENATGASTAALLSPFPTVAEVADTACNWNKSNVANTTARNFDIFVGATFVIFCINWQGTTDIWDVFFYADVPPALTGDAYNTVVNNRNYAANLSSTTGINLCRSSLSPVLNMVWARSYDGTINSTTGAFSMTSNSAIPGAGSGLGPTALTGPSTGVDMEKTKLQDGGATSTSPSVTKSMICRGFLPNLWMPLNYGHGTLTTRNTFACSAYNPSASFMVFCMAAAPASGGFVVIETTDTWSPPGV